MLTQATTVTQALFDHTFLLEYLKEALDIGELQWFSIGTPPEVLQPSVLGFPRVTLTSVGVPPDFLVSTEDYPIG